jgi:HAD superfamily hydrolase (TIGR01509 family)
VEKYKNFVFDVNGVLLEGPSAITIFTKYYDIPPEIQKDLVKYNKANFRKNQYSKAHVVFNNTLKYFGIDGDLEKSKKMFEEIFNAEEIIPGVEEVINELKRRRFNLYILSNEFRARTLVSNIKFKDFFSLFVGIVYGWEEDMYKPDINMWKRLQEKYDILSNESVYVDDKEENRNVASGLGYRVFSSVDEMKTKLDI